MGVEQCNGNARLFQLELPRKGKTREAGSANDDVEKGSVMPMVLQGAPRLLATALMTTASSGGLQSVSRPLLCLIVDIGGV